VTGSLPPECDTSSDAPITEEEEASPWLVCEACGCPLVREAELIEEKFDTWNKVTWAYELSVLGRESTWCYSATNAHDHRFDVVRVLPSAAGRSICCRGEPTPEYSWFPGFSWSMAHCRQCSRHIGWGFSPDKPPPAACGSGGGGGEGARPGGQKRAAEAEPADASGAPPTWGLLRGAPESEVPASNGTAVEGVGAERDSTGANEEVDMEADEADEGQGGGEEPVPVQLAFFGLVLTKMREKDLSSSEVERRLQALEELRERRHEHQALLQRVQRLLRGMPGSALLRHPLMQLLQLLHATHSSGRLDRGLLARFEAAFSRAADAAEGAPDVDAVAVADVASTAEPQARDGADPTDPPTEGDEDPGGVGGSGGGGAPAAEQPGGAATGRGSGEPREH